MNILIVDDDELLTLILRDFLVEQGHQALVAMNGREGLLRCEEAAPDLAIVDIFMPEMDGLEFIQNLQEISPETRVIAITGMYQAAEWSLRAAEQLGAAAVLEKPFSFQDIAAEVERMALH